MTPQTEPKIVRLPIADIAIKDRLRPVKKAGVESLKKSILELGVIKDAIHVRQKGRGDKIKYELIAGGHRLAAATDLEWEDIPTRIWVDVTDDFCRLMEIDDNLAGSDLSALELSVFLAERKRVYEKLHPETRAKVAGGHAKAGSATETVSFADSVAQQRDLSPRHIRNFVRIGERLAGWELDALQAMENPLGVKQLMALASVEDTSDREDIVKLLAAGEAKSVADALTEISGGQSTAPDAPLMSALRKAWTRASGEDKAEFLRLHGEELADLMGGEG